MINVIVIYSSAPRQVRQWALILPLGSNIKQAIVQSGLLDEFLDLSLAALTVGIWGEGYALDKTLKDHDRIEIYRPLRVDPKVARRERFTRQGAKRAGLFATKRVGAKAGYGG